MRQGPEMEFTVMCPARQQALADIQQQIRGHLMRSEICSLEHCYTTVCKSLLPKSLPGQVSFRTIEESCEWRYAKGDEMSCSKETTFLFLT